jgi:ATP-binding cassette subfamily B protein
MKQNIQQEDTTHSFSLQEIWMACHDLPRIVRLVWKASPSLFVGTMCVTILQGITSPLLAIIAGFLINGVVTGISQRTLEPVIVPLVVQLLVTLMSQGAQYLSRSWQILLNHRLSDYLSLLILQKASTLDLATFEDADFYDRFTRANQEVSHKPLQFITQLFTLVSNLVTLFLVLGLLTQLHWWLAVIVLLIPIPSFIVESRYGLRAYRVMFWQSSKKRRQWYLTHLLTTDLYIKEIKLFNLAPLLIERYRTVSLQMYEQDRQLQRRHTRIGMLWLLLPICMNAGIYLLVAFEAIQGRLSIGGLTQYALIIGQVGQNVQAGLGSLAQIYELRLFMTTLFDFLAHEPQIVAPASAVSVQFPAAPSVPDPANEGQHGHNGRINNSRDAGSQRPASALIEFRDVSFCYPGKSEAALHHLTFTVKAGERIALVGENGAGKTTLVKLLTRLYDPTGGEIRIAGHNIKEYDVAELHEHIGVIFQDYIRYSMTAHENIGLGRLAEMNNRELVEKAACKSGADKVIAKLDAGYETMLGHWFEKGVEMSGGEWQKVALARAFMRDAPLLILDEPTSSLDAQAERELFQRFLQLTTGRTVILISHRFSTVRLADRILVIEHGKLIEQGTHQELMALQGRYAELFSLQAEAYML